MNIRNIARYEALKRIENLCNDHTPELSSIAGYNDEKTDLNTTLAQVATAMQTQAQEFDLRSKLIYAGVRHNQLVFHVEDAQTQAPIQAGIITNLKKNIPIDIDGTATFDCANTSKQTYNINSVSATSKTKRQP